MPCPAVESDKSMRLFDFALHPHPDHESFPKNSLSNLENLAANTPNYRYYIIL